MKELTFEQMELVSGGGCDTVAGGTVGGAIVAGGLYGAGKGKVGLWKGAAIGAALGMLGGAIGYGVCKVLPD